jgi:hypothetical protein
MEALELAMRLAHTAPNSEKSTACLEMAVEISMNMTSEEITTVEEELLSEGIKIRELRFWSLLLEGKS